MAMHKYLFMFIYSVISLPIFFKVYYTSKSVIDEEFHLRQGLHYCTGNFTVWDPKITTFPGLYLASSFFLWPIQACNIFNLRLTSLIASLVNFALIYELRKLVIGRRPSYEWKTSLETFTICLLPPMYFFAHLYYTDILSVTAVLGLILYNMKHEHNTAALFGLASVLMRQTNIIWVGMALGNTVIDKLVSQTLPFINDNKSDDNDSKPGKPVYTFEDIGAVLGFYARRFYLIPKQINLLVAYLMGYVLILVAFIIFIIVNGSIVVGDKSAHEASLHLPQILYFSLFSAIFGVSLTLTHFRSALKLIIRRWYITICTVIILTIIVHYNTIIHPYILADNRIYRFYIWNRFYGKYYWARYSIIPAYIYSLAILHRSIDHKSAGFKLVYWGCLIAVIGLQQLIEFRYFIIPFLLLRVNAGPIRARLLFVELFSYIVINMITFYLFFTKEIWWSNYTDAQRFIW